MGSSVNGKLDVGHGQHRGKARLEQLWFAGHEPEHIGSPCYAGDVEELRHGAAILQQNGPRRGAHQKRCPERQQYENHQDAGGSLRQGCQHEGNRIAENKRAQGHQQADAQRAAQYLQINPPVLGRAFNPAVHALPQVQRTQQVIGRKGAPCPFHHGPGAHIFPNRVSGRHSFHPWPRFDLVELPGGDRHLGFESRNFIVQALADQRHGSCLAGSLEVRRKGRKHLFTWKRLAVPLAQQFGSLRQIVDDIRIIEGILQHRP